MAAGTVAVEQVADSAAAREVDEIDESFVPLYNASDYLLFLVYLTAQQYCTYPKTLMATQSQR